MGRDRRSIFDVDTIDLGPERRAYLEHKLERVWEINSEGSIPYVPYLRAPYYIWIGQNHQDGRECLMKWHRLLNASSTMNMFLRALDDG